MALSLNKYNCIVDSTDEEDEISSKDNEKTSTNPLTHLSNSFSSSHISNVKAVSLSDHELDAKELSSKKKKKKKEISCLFRLWAIKRVNLACVATTIVSIKKPCRNCSFFW